MDLARETPVARSLWKLCGTFLWVRITDRFLPPGLTSNLIVVLGLVLLLLHHMYSRNNNDHRKHSLTLPYYGKIACITDTSSSSADESFSVDSGSFCHATGNKNTLDPASITYGLFGTVTVGDGSVLAVAGHGSVNRSHLKLACVLYVPRLMVNVVSVRQLTALDYQVQFVGDEFFVREICTDAMVGRGRLGGDGMYRVESLQVPLDRGRCLNCLFLGHIYDQS